MNAADPTRSMRLQRVVKALRKAGGAGLTTMGIISATRTVAPATCVSELRARGIRVTCVYEGRKWGSKIYRYTLVRA